MNTERADYLQHLMGHSRCAERYRIGLVKFGKDKMLPGVVARASIQSEVRKQIHVHSSPVSRNW